MKTQTKTVRDLRAELAALTIERDLALLFGNDTSKVDASIAAVDQQLLDMDLLELLAGSIAAVGDQYLC